MDRWIQVSKGLPFPVVCQKCEAREQCVHALATGQPQHTHTPSLPSRHQRRVAGKCHACPCPSSLELCHVRWSKRLMQRTQSTSPLDVHSSVQQRDTNGWNAVVGEKERRGSGCVVWCGLSVKASSRARTLILPRPAGRSHACLVVCVAACVPRACPLSRGRGWKRHRLHLAITRTQCLLLLLPHPPTTQARAPAFFFPSHRNALPCHPSVVYLWPASSLACAACIGAKLKSKDATSTSLVLQRPRAHNQSPQRHGAGAARGGMVCVCVVAALWQAHAWAANIHSSTSSLSQFWVIAQGQPVSGLITHHT